MSNLLIRETLKAYGIKHWQLANALGISESTLVKWLRLELPEDKASSILKVIEDMRDSRTN